MNIKDFTEICVFLSKEDMRKLSFDHYNLSLDENEQTPRNSYISNVTELKCMARVVTDWFYKTNCAMLTGWRQKDIVGKKMTRKENLARNKELEAQLKSLGYSYKAVQGCYREKGEDKFTKENSYIVFDNYDDLFEFTNRMYELSTRFNQDSFIIRPKGKGQDTKLMYADGSNKIETFKQLHVNSKSSDAYTKIGNGTLVFE